MIKEQTRLLFHIVIIKMSSLIRFGTKRTGCWHLGFYLTRSEKAPFVFSGRSLSKFKTFMLRKLFVRRIPK